MDDGSSELDTDNGDGHMRVDLSFNLGVKSTSVHLLDPFTLLTYNKGSSSSCLANSTGLWGGPSEIKV